MIRTILRSENKNLTLQLPDDLVGKTIEIIAFSIETANTGAEEPMETETEISVTAFKSKINGLAFNSGGYKFNRDEANDYE